MPDFALDDDHISLT